MTNAQCEAIINAIKESVSFLYTNGIPIRERISDASTDAAAVSALVTAYEATMDGIISDLPDES